MRHVVIVIIVWCGFATICRAQQKQSVLWEISGNGLAKKSYLFGTMHTAKKEIYYKFPKLSTLIKKSDIGLFELNGKPIGNINKNTADTAKIHSMPLGKVFTTRQFAIVDSFFTRSPFGSIQPTDSVPLFTVLQLAALVKQNNGKQETLFDDFLHSQMVTLKKETFELDNRNDPSIRAAVTDTTGMVKQLMAIIQGKSSDEDDDDYTQRLSIDMKLNKKVTGAVKVATVSRNQIWVPKIMDKMKQGSCFIIVGVGHLQYTTGLIALLRHKGYVLKPVILKRST